MIWAEIKKALNETVGTNSFNPLNKIVSRTAYESYYDTSDFINSLIGNNDGTTVVIPKGVITIPSDVYSNNDNVKNILIPYGVSKIERNAFSACRNLEHIRFPDTLTDIGIQAFANCDSLKSIFIPSSVKNINAQAFISCDDLESIYIDSVEDKAPTGAPWGAASAVVYYKQGV